MLFRKLRPKMPHRREGGTFTKRSFEDNGHFQVQPGNEVRGEKDVAVRLHRHAVGAGAKVNTAGSKVN